MRCIAVSPSPRSLKPRKSLPEAATHASSEATASPSNSRAISPSSNGITLRDIAKKLRISHVTVSLALRGAPGISESRRRQIEAMAIKMGYRPNTNAAALGRRRSGTPSSETGYLAWINPCPGTRAPRPDAEQALFRKGARETAQQYGYILEELVNANLSPGQFHQALQARNITGILVPFHSGHAKFWEGFPWSEYAVVRFGDSMVRPKFPSVTSDHFGNCRLALHHLRSSGYHRIGFVTDRDGEGRFAAAFLTAQLGFSSSQRVPVHHLVSRTSNIIEEQRLEQWIAKYQPDALLTDLALPPRMLKGAGHLTPGSLALATLNTIKSPELAGINPKPEAVGSAAAEMLIQQINARRLKIPPSDRELHIAGEWINGPSVPLRADPGGE